MPSAERLFHAVHLGVFSSALRVEEYSTSGKMLRSSLSLSSQPTNQSGGGAGLPTVLWLNNNGEVNIAFLLVFIFFTRSNCRTRNASVRHVSNHNNHSFSTKKKKVALSSAHS